MGIRKRELWWDFPAKGQSYEWADCWLSNEDGDLERHVSCLVARKGTAFRRYRPLEAPVALYRELAAVDLTPAAMLDFANRYGLLGEGVVKNGGLEPYTEGTKTADEIEVDAVESFDAWRQEIFWLSESLWLWDAAEAGDVRRLAERLSWTGAMFVYHLPPRDWARNNLPPMPICLLIDEESDSLLTPRDVVRAASLLVLSQINVSLSDGVHPTLVWDAQRNRADLLTVPASLHGAIWLQFAQAVHGKKKSRQCVECGRWFEVSPGTSRNDRLTCSDSCRSKSYLKRRERAAELYAQGKKIKEIAVELGSEVETVKKWVAKKKEK